MSTLVKSSCLGGVAGGTCPQWEPLRLGDDETETWRGWMTLLRSSVAQLGLQNFYDYTLYPILSSAQWSSSCFPLFGLIVVSSGHLPSTSTSICLPVLMSQQKFQNAVEPTNPQDGSYGEGQWQLCHHSSHLWAHRSFGAEFWARRQVISDWGSHKRWPSACDASHPGPGCVLYLE